MLQAQNVRQHAQLKIIGKTRCFSIDCVRSPLCGSMQKISLSPTEGFFGFEHPPPGNSSLASYFSLKILAFEIPLPFGISNDVPWGGYFLEPHMHCDLLMHISPLLRPVTRFCFEIWFSGSLFYLRLLWLVSCDNFGFIVVIRRPLYKAIFSE